MATHDTDQWVSMIGEILKTFPSMGTLNLDLEDNGIFSEMTSDLNKAGMVYLSYDNCIDDDVCFNIILFC